ncbi:hypothetical protein Gpo141_00002701 [Globisporangium polare]
MSIESAQQNGANAEATPRNAKAVASTPSSAVDNAAIQQQQQQQVAMSAMVQMNDVLLGDEMSMMGCDVDSWTTHAARPHFHPQSQQSQQSNAYFTCPPANLTRHMSLPMHHYATSTPVNGGHQNMNMPPPSLARHHSHGYVLPPPQQQQMHYRPVNVAQMQQMFELSISNQHHQQLQHQQLKNESFAPMNSGINVEPMPFTSMHDAKLGMVDDGFDLEPLTYAVFGASERPKNIQQLESAIESLDRLLPDMGHDIFQQQQQQNEFVHMQQHAMAPRHNGNNNLITPRNVVYGRGSLPLLLSPHGKEIASSPASASAMALSGMLISSHTPKSAKNMATCKIGGCDRRVRSKGFCKTHGGGRKCSIEGCKKSSQNGDFCIGHGGGKKCKEEGCAKAAQSHGLCKAHGGGARCKFLDCNKSSQGGGLCRAHGGGKRCQASGCPKGAQRGNFCATHGGFRNCKIDGCVRTDRGGGFCEVHRRGRLCKIEGCKKLSRNQGMCTMHIREDKQDDVDFSEDALVEEYEADFTDAAAAGSLVEA